MTQSVFIQVGQCGNQIGHRFWDLALTEHKIALKNGVSDSSTSSFFLNRTDDNSGFQSGLKARALLVDMEEGVVNEILKGPLKNLYDTSYLITDVSGSGNNWAVGNLYYGRVHQDALCEALRKSAELCDCLQCFFILHSMGGGTGSGVGTHILKILADDYPNVYKMDVAVFPSVDDDVVTSPYNTVLALNQITEFADCVLPIDNIALCNIIDKANTCDYSGSNVNNMARRCYPKSTKLAKPFDDMNNIVANMLLNLTSSSRFEGTMNVDLNEISMNLVPFPRLHYLISSQSPISTSFRTSAPRKLDQIFSDTFTKDYQLMSTDPCRHVYLAAALLVRGAINASDLRRNIDK
ncbi:Tubulin epsilon chain [Schistosoma japonicum]|uniref:Tubulin epsilon chain n=1 Tax=Schistosoma japonicum TaxID=6182 RepID=A0A4Z2CV93_SCHJA|nr:Tubulin epsilon chain [Schistosoma japonicum]